jgi:hypothetical protein
MGMVGQGAGPGVQHTQAPEEAAAIMWVRRERDERWRRRSEQEVLAVLLMTPDDRPELVGHGEDQMAVGDRQAFMTPFCPPHLGLMTVTGGAAAGAAGVGDLVFLTTVITLEHVPSQDLRATVEQVCYRSPMARAQILSESVQVGTAITPNDVRQLRHVRARSA